MPDIDIIQFHDLINWAFETGSTMSRVRLCFEPLAPVFTWSLVFRSGLSIGAFSAFGKRTSLVGGSSNLGFCGRPVSSTSVSWQQVHALIELQGLIDAAVLGVLRSVLLSHAH